MDCIRLTTYPHKNHSLRRYSKNILIRSVSIYIWWWLIPRWRLQRCLLFLLLILAKRHIGNNKNEEILLTHFDYAACLPELESHEHEDTVRLKQYLDVPKKNISKQTNSAIRGNTCKSRSISRKCNSDTYHCKTKHHCEFRCEYGKRKIVPHQKNKITQSKKKKKNYID